MTRRQNSGGECWAHEKPLIYCEECARHIEANIKWRTLECVHNQMFEVLLKPVGKLVEKELWQLDPFRKIKFVDEEVEGSG